MQRKIVGLVGIGFRQVKAMALDIASLSAGGIIKFVQSAITTKVVVFVDAMETGGKGVGQLTGGLVMSLRGQKAALRFRARMVGTFE